MRAPTGTPTARRPMHDARRGPTAPAAPDTGASETLTVQQRPTCDLRRRAAANASIGSRDAAPAAGPKRTLLVDADPMRSATGAGATGRRSVGPHSRADRGVSGGGATLKPATPPTLPTPRMPRMPRAATWLAAAVLACPRASSGPRSTPADPGAAGDGDGASASNADVGAAGGGPTGGRSVSPQSGADRAARVGADGVFPATGAAPDPATPPTLPMPPPMQAATWPTPQAATRPTRQAATRPSPRAGAARAPGAAI